MSTVQLIPITKIRVLNTRARNKAKFNEIVANVSQVGLKRPITVCPRTGSSGEYDLVCGQGRFEAMKEIAKARAIVERRIASGKRTRSGSGKHPRKKMSTEDLVKTYKRSIQRQALLVRRAHACESMLRIIYGAIRELLKDDHFVTLLRAERLNKMPKPLAEQVHQRGAR